MKDSDRQIGRTLRMLQGAAEYKKQHGRVLVVVHQVSMISYCAGLCRRHELTLASRDFATVQTVVQNFQLRGRATANEVYIDHFVGNRDCGISPTIMTAFYAELDILRRYSGEG